MNFAPLTNGIIAVFVIVSMVVLCVVIVHSVVVLVVASLKFELSLRKFTTSRCPIRYNIIISKMPQSVTVRLSIVFTYIIQWRRHKFEGQGVNAFEGGGEGLIK